MTVRVFGGKLKNKLPRLWLDYLEDCFLATGAKVRAICALVAHFRAFAGDDNADFLAGLLAPGTEDFSLADK